MIVDFDEMIRDELEGEVKYLELARELRRKGAPKVVVDATIGMAEDERKHASILLIFKTKKTWRD